VVLTDRGVGLDGGFGADRVESYQSAEFLGFEGAVSGSSGEKAEKLLG
jgi:hypothetical protein